MLSCSLNFGMALCATRSCLAPCSTMLQLCYLHVAPPVTQSGPSVCIVTALRNRMSWKNIFTSLVLKTSMTLTIHMPK